MSSVKSHHVRLNSKSFESPRHNTAMTSLNHSNNLSLVTLHFPSSTSPPSSAASSSSTSSNGWTDKITKKIEELKSELDDLNNLKEAKNGYLPDQDSKSLDSLPTQVTSLETVSKLADFAEQLDTAKNNSNNILNNLCTGLEKFLGFNPSSKGYNGSGIVYSDLDRLCDGVMGFLSGVLDAVKKENEVTTYDNYITKPDKKLNEVLDLLTTKIGSGRAGLAVSVAAVKGWLGKYNEKVNEETENIKKPINDLIKANGDNIPKLLETIKGMQNKAYEDVATRKKHLLTWMSRVKGLPELSAASIKELKKIDGTLQKKIHAHITVVDQAVKDFVDSADHGYSDLLKVNSEVSMKLTDLKLEVYKNADIEKRTCIKALENEFESNIKDPINKLKTDLGDLNVKLNEWIQKTQLVVDTAVSKCTEILGHVKDKGQSKTWQAVEEAAGKLEKKARKLYDVANSVRKQIGDWVGTALRMVKEMDTKLKLDLKDVKLQMETDIKKYVKNQLLNKIKADVEGIKGEKDREHGMEGIVTGVKRYAAAYGSQFAETIGEWVDDILTTNDGGSGLRSYWIKIGKSISKYNEGDALHGAVVDAINKELRSLIMEAQQKVNEVRTDDLNSIESNITAVYSCISVFVQKLGNIMSNRVGAIVTEIENSVKLGIDPLKRGRNNTDLESAVKATLIALHSTANQVSAEIEGLIEDFNFRNVNTVLDVARPLSNSLEQALRNNTDSTSGDSTYNVNKNVEEILNRNIGESNTTTITDLSAYFALYKEHIKQDATSLNALTKGEVQGSDKENKLPRVIKEIQNHVENVKHLGNVQHNAAPIIASITEHADVDGDFYSDTFQQLYQHVNEELRKLCTAVKNLVENDSAADEAAPDRKAVNNLLKDLQTMLGDGADKKIYDLKMHLQEIQNQIQETIIGEEGDPPNKPSTLSGINNACGMFYGQTINKKVTDCVTNIKQTLLSQVTDKIKTLQKSALSQFAQSKAAALQKLQELVTEEKSKIDEIIAEDLKSGLKGMMGKMKDNQTFLDTVEKQTELRTATPQVRMFVDVLLQYVEDQVKISTAQQPKKDTVASTKIAGVKAMLGLLLDDLSSSNHFDHTFSRNLADFTDSLSALQPSTFAGHTHPELPDAMKGGLRKLVGELGRAYVSRYEGSPAIGQWEIEDTESKKDGQEGEIKKILTPDGRRCAKVLCTILRIMNDDLSELYKQCAEDPAWWGRQIYKSTDAKKNALPDFLQSRGYQIPSSNSNQDGELQRSTKMNGRGILAKLHARIHDSVSQKHLAECKPNDKETIFNVVDLIACMFNHVNEYNRVCHFATSNSKKHPSSVYAMLRWLCGLSYNSVYNDVLINDFYDLFEKPEDKSSDENEDGVVFEGNDADTLEAHPNTITASNLRGFLTEVCHYSYDVLTAISGHGHADGIYAVDFNTNPDGFSYPTAPGACFDMLCDVLNRLYQQLYFVYKQCSNDESCAGWLNCWYGQGVGGSSFNCNSKQCANQICDQKAKQKRDQIHDQSDDQHPNCGLKSPLQSFLEDGLPGFLPHQFDKVGCKLDCSMTNHRGLPCKTPMGFVDISVMASHTQNGAYLKKVLKDFCGSDSAPLTQLCAQLACLLQNPPQTLGDIFAFYYSYLKDWAGDYYGIITDKQHTQQAFEEAVNAAYFGTQYGDLDPSELCSSKVHTGKHTKGDLISIVGCTTGSDKPCGLYVTSIAQQITRYYASDHKGNHLSWIVYITETFYDLLKKLYDECCAKCDKRGTRCHDKRCVEACEIKYINGKGEPTTPSTDKHHSKECKSIITCRNTHPTLYKYGFTFGNPLGLSGIANNDEAKRTCKDFCEALKKMLGEGSVLITLREQIDDFLWAIRLNFSITVLALWLLSLLYLLHIMVIRLDLFHIKSHLHSPSSHRIAAQSLLAAGRVNKLGKVFYLQP